MSLTFRQLEESELPDLWSIDRAEVVRRGYRVEGGALVPYEVYFDIKGWSQDRIPRDTELLKDCFEHGGYFFGAFLKESLVGASVLENRFIGQDEDQLQLKFLHVSHDMRGTGLGRRLFEQAADQARRCGAKALYISATASENTVHFYQHRGCLLAGTPDAALLALEPEDIHFICPLG